MDMKKSKRLVYWLAGIYWGLVLMIYLIATGQFEPVTYFSVTGALFVTFAAYAFYGFCKLTQGHLSGILSVCLLYSKYQFLLRQLVSRDFKTKYKRSMLGMAWSILNPLLTMAVQYVVFSTLFQSSTENYPVYLLTGIIFFNFFNEAISTGMTSITGNASLIQKVYIPKYILPVSKLFTSLVNFSLTFIPLVLLVLLTGTPLRPSFLLLIFNILCLMAFVMGMILLLSTAMVFFQDTQFLWGIVNMMWMYLTPVFYTESIIPEAILPAYRMNPMYQMIEFARTCIIDGVSPDAGAYLRCAGWAAGSLLLGIITFKRKQGKFTLHL